MNNNKFRVSAVITIFVSILIGVALAAVFFLNSSNGAKLDDPKEILNTAIDKTVGDEGDWAYQATVIDGQHPWDIESIIVRGNINNDIEMVELFGKGLSFVSGENTYLLIDDQLPELSNWDGVMVLSAKEVALSGQFIRQLESSGLVVTPKNIAKLEVANTLIKQRVNSRLLRHYEVTKSGAIDLVSFGKLLDDYGYNFAKTHDYDDKLTFTKGDIWIDDESGKIVKLQYTFASNQDESTTYTVEITPIAPLAQSEYVLAITPDYPTTTALVDYKVLDITEVLEKVGLTHFSNQLKDITMYKDLLNIEKLVRTYSEENFYYPTSDELEEYILNSTQPELAKALNKTVYYEPQEPTCNNDEANYCSGYKLWIDSYGDGRGSHDADNNPIDYFKEQN